MSKIETWVTSIAFNRKNVQISPCNGDKKLLSFKADETL